MISYDYHENHIDFNAWLRYQIALMIQQKTYQAKAHDVAMKKSAQVRKTTKMGDSVTPDAKWYHIDATDMVVGRLATVIANLITGKHKPVYTKHADTGDFVVITNADKVAFTGKKWSDKMYYSYSGKIGGLKQKNAELLLQTKPTEILKQAVWGMTSRHNLARAQMKKLKIYASDTHPHQAQKFDELPSGAVRKTVLMKAKK